MTDFLTLCKPKIVLLMLLTAWVGMVCGSNAQAPLTWSLFCVATLGIGLVAASAAAVNHLLDRRLDANMSRTRNRPVASGRVSPKTAWTFAFVLGTVGLATLFWFVNPLTAFLSLLTLGGYAFFYTLFLKRVTPQNIVIGGAAGAMPPLLGWAAISNSIHPHALLLVLIIFAWTPPHFWALAIFRKEDYQKVSIPMLPITHGISYTKLSILLYTTLLFMVTLLPFVTGMSGLLYLVVALILGLLFLSHSIHLYLSNEARTSHKAFSTFGFSIIYLLLLFLALMLDHLVFSPNLVLKSTDLVLDRIM